MPVLLSITLLAGFLLVENQSLNQKDFYQWIQNSTTSVRIDTLKKMETDPNPFDIGYQQYYLTNKSKEKICLPQHELSGALLQGPSLFVTSLINADGTKRYSIPSNIIWEPIMRPWPESLKSQLVLHPHARLELYAHRYQASQDWALNFEVKAPGTYYHIASIYGAECDKQMTGFPPFHMEVGSIIFSNFLEGRALFKGTSTTLKKHGGILFFHIEKVIIMQEDIDAANVKRKALIEGTGTEEEP